VRNEDSLATAQDDRKSLPDWEFLGRKVLVVSTFRPNQDGIARYTDHLLEGLAPSGRRFTRLGIASGGGDRVRLLAGALRPLWILAHARDADDILIMYIPTYFQRGGFGSRLASLLSLWTVSRVRRTTFVIHEPDVVAAPTASRRETIEFAVLERVRRLLWGRGTAVVFHTEWERQRFERRFPGHGRRTERLVSHGASFTSSVAAVSVVQARDRLGLPHDRAIVLMIGFISPHKRFERGVEAVTRAARQDLDLYIVGSPISDWPEVTRCVEELRAMAATASGVHLREQFVSDEEFDMWIRASDAVLVPYGEASSSGVVPRAQLLGTTVIASGAGGIAEQLTGADTRFADDGELLDAIRAVPAHDAQGAKAPAP
jgi:glycosyltransferase involved in cell wall biosynthesis